jgi:hypothetical protein
MYGSVRGAASDGRPYRDTWPSDGFGPEHADFGKYAFLSLRTLPSSKFGHLHKRPSEIITGPKAADNVG